MTMKEERRGGTDQLIKKAANKKLVLFCGIAVLWMSLFLTNHNDVRADRTASPDSALTFPPGTCPETVPKLHARLA